MAAFVSVKPIVEPYDDGGGVALDEKGEPLFAVWKNGRETRPGSNKYTDVWTYWHARRSLLSDTARCDLCGRVQQEDKLSIEEICVWKDASKDGPKTNYQICTLCICENKMVPYLPDGRVYVAHIQSNPGRLDVPKKKEEHYITAKSWLEFTKKTLEFGKGFHADWRDCLATSVSVDEKDSTLDAKAILQKHKGTPVATFALPDFYRVFSAPHKFSRPAYLASPSFEAAMLKKKASSSAAAAVASDSSKKRKTTDSKSEVVSLIIVDEEGDGDSHYLVPTMSVPSALRDKEAIEQYPGGKHADVISKFIDEIEKYKQDGGQARYTGVYEVICIAGWE